MEFTEIISWAVSLIDMLELSDMITAVFIIAVSAWGLRTLINAVRE